MCVVFCLSQELWISGRFAILGYKKLFSLPNHPPHSHLTSRSHFCFLDPPPSLCVRRSNEPWYDWLSSMRSMRRLAASAVTWPWLVTFSLHVSPESRAHSGTIAFKAVDARFVIVLLFSLILACACQQRPNRADRALFSLALFISVRQMKAPVERLRRSWLS